MSEKQVILDVYVQPNSSHTEVSGEFDGRIKIRVKSPPSDGAANRELLSFLAKALGVKKSSIHLISGEKNRRKRVQIKGLTEEECASRL